jgi:HEPN domain-containing protein
MSGELDSQRVADTLTWLIKAQRDIITAEQLFAYEAPLLDSIAYHCQQAGEKTLKAFLFWHDLPLTKTHDLEVLLAKCAAIDATLLSLQAAAAMLTPLATQFRYPGDAIEPPLEDTRRAFDNAKSIFAAVIRRLPPEVAPPT